MISDFGHTIEDFLRDKSSVLQLKQERIEKENRDKMCGYPCYIDIHGIKRNWNCDEEYCAYCLTCGQLLLPEKTLKGNTYNQMVVCTDCYNEWQQHNVKVLLISYLDVLMKAQNTIEKLDLPPQNLLIMHGNRKPTKNTIKPSAGQKAYTLDITGKITETAVNSLRKELKELKEIEARLESKKVEYIQILTKVNSQYSNVLDKESYVQRLPQIKKIVNEISELDIKIQKHKEAYFQYDRKNSLQDGRLLNGKQKSTIRNRLMWYYLRNNNETNDAYWYTFTVPNFKDGRKYDPQTHDNLIWQAFRKMMKHLSRHYGLADYMTVTEVQDGKRNNFKTQTNAIHVHAVLIFDKVVQQNPKTLKYEESLPIHIQQINYLWAYYLDNIGEEFRVFKTFKPAELKYWTQVLGENNAIIESIVKGTLQPYKNAISGTVPPLYSHLELAGWILHTEQQRVKFKNTFDCSVKDLGVYTKIKNPIFKAIINPVQAEKIDSLRKLGMYMTKYVTKQNKRDNGEETRKIYCSTWSCSSNFKQVVCKRQISKHLLNYVIDSKKVTRSYHIKGEKDGHEYEVKAWQFDPNEFYNDKILNNQLLAFMASDNFKKNSFWSEYNKLVKHYRKELKNVDTTKYYQQAGGWVRNTAKIIQRSVSKLQQTFFERVKQLETLYKTNYIDYRVKLIKGLIQNEIRVVQSRLNRLESIGRKGKLYNKIGFKYKLYFQSLHDLYDTVEEKLKKAYKRKDIKALIQIESDWQTKQFAINY